MLHIVDWDLAQHAEMHSALKSIARGQDLDKLNTLIQTFIEDFIVTESPQTMLANMFVCGYFAALEQVISATSEHNALLAFVDAVPNTIKDL